MKNASWALLAMFGFAVAGLSMAQTPTVAPPPGAPATAPPSAAPPSTAPAATPAPAPGKSNDAMEGLAAVYSDKLAGRKTASGEVFSQGKLTAAHPSLAFGTKVRVTNIKNNKSVEVRINDRGPTQAGRVIDLSSAAAARIGIGKKQMLPVKLEVTGEAPARKGAK